MQISAGALQVHVLGQMTLVRDCLLRGQVLQRRWGSLSLRHFSLASTSMTWVLALGKLAKGAGSFSPAVLLLVRSRLVENWDSSANLCRCFAGARPWTGDACSCLFAACASVGETLGILKLAPLLTG